MPDSIWRASLLPLTLAASLAGAPPAAAQWLPDTPLQGHGGRLSLGGEVVVGAGTSDDGAFFNYTGYERHALRVIRGALSVAWRPWEPLALVGEARAEPGDGVRVFAAYLSVRPWRALDVQAGRIPPVFGAFGRRVYAHDSGLIGYPLAYQYLTSLRSNAVPLDASDLIRMRGRGWLSSFPAGAQTPGPGLPLVNAFRWDDGVQVRWLAGPVEAAAAATAGSLSDPGGGHRGAQLSGRVAVAPLVGLTLGISGARGPWLDDALRPPGGTVPRQRAFGLDAEYSRDHWVVRAEAVVSAWDLPHPAATSNGRSVRASAGWVEGRYRLTPRVYTALRADRLRFSTLPAAGGGERVTWDAAVDRVEAAVGWYLQRNVVIRAGVQGNWRDTARAGRRTYLGTQAIWWF